MPFRPQRNQLIALIVYLSTLGITACAIHGPPPLSGAAGETAIRHPLLWEVIDGGREGNFLIGGRDVRFMRPTAVAARGNLVYIVDGGRNLLYRYDRITGRLGVLKELKGLAAGPVTDIYVDRDLSFYLADPDGERVLYFNRRGHRVQVFKDERHLVRPIAVALDEVSGQVLIADVFNDYVLRFNRSGVVEGAIGGRGDQPGLFRMITSLAVGRAGLYVATRQGEHRVQTLGLDGTYHEAFQKDTVTFPTAIVAVPDGRIYVSDFVDNTIKVYKDDRLVDTLGGTGETPGRFKQITDLWFDDGWLYVADGLNGRIQALPVE